LFIFLRDKESLPLVPALIKIIDDMTSNMHPGGGILLDVSLSMPTESWLMRTKILKKLLNIIQGSSQLGMGKTVVQLNEELSGLKVSVLKRHAKRIGVNEVSLDDADDEDDIKGTVIQLILEREASLLREQRDQRHRELSQMKVSVLKRHAKSIGVNEESLDDADDEDNTKETVIQLILNHEMPTGVEHASPPEATLSGD
jgi:hypothetical protein